MPETRTRRRADAERSIAAIVEAARSAFAAGATVSMSEVARAAGVGRVTLYSHFPSREALLDAVIRQVITETRDALDALGLDADPPDVALARLARESWQYLDESRRLRAVAMTTLGPDRMRQLHEDGLDWPDRLIDRGRAEGVFRTDLPPHWQVATFYGLMHTAADEVDAGRLDSAQVPQVLATTLLATLAAR